MSETSRIEQTTEAVPCSDIPTVTPQERYHDLLVAARVKWIEAGGLNGYHAVLARANELIRAIYWDGTLALDFDRKASQALADLAPVAEVQKLQHFAAEKREAIVLQRQQLAQVRAMLTKEKQGALASLHQALGLASNEYWSVHALAAEALEAEIMRRTEDLHARLSEERAFLRQHDPQTLGMVRDALPLCEPEQEVDAERPGTVELQPANWWSKDGSFDRQKQWQDAQHNRPDGR